ncbi:MAG TPA: flagellin hook IN motif-containing protein, partial [Cellvibrionaceae bacterium]|nr:flagellin hook IN motif-containing protein [Cellvibrionaceae bacterium]
GKRLNDIELERASERLASGLRLIHAGDDAPGSAITSRRTSQVRGNSQAERNANDGIALLQTADGAIVQYDQILQRLRELAIQSANGIYTDSDRVSLDAEAQQLTQELDRIAKATTFNARPLLDGSFGPTALQVGESDGDRLEIQLPSLDSNSLGLGTSPSGALIGSSLVLSGNNTLASAIQANHVLINGQDIGEVAAGTRLDELLDHINNDMHGIKASTLVELEGTQVGTGVLGDGDSLTLSVSRLDGTTNTFSVSNTRNLAELADAISTATGGQVRASINAKGYLILSATDLANLSVSDSTGSASGLSGGSLNSGSVHQSVINGLTSYWIREAETLITTNFGLSAPANTQIDLLFAETDGTLTGDVTGLSPAQQTSLASDGPSNGIASVWSDPAHLKLTVDMADFVTPEGSPWLYNDRVIAHEMVHAVMAASVSSGINNSLPGWFSEGIAEFIHGADERVLGDIQANTPPASATSVGIAAVAGALKTTPGSPSSSLGYSAGYSAVRMLHDEILANGGAGLSDVLTALAGGTSLTAAINSAAGVSLAAFEAHFAAHGDAYLTDALNGTSTSGAVSLNGATSHMNFNDTITGSIAGSDYGHGTLTAASVLPNTASGGPINFSLKLPDGYSAGSTGASAKLVLSNEFGEPASLTLGVEGRLSDLANLG